jgi:hypothetical protein
MLFVATVLAVACLGTAACSAADGVARTGRGRSTSPSTLPAASSEVSSPAAKPSGKPKKKPAKPACPNTGFPCDLRARFAAADSYASGRPGTTGIVVHDLRTGAMWQNDHAQDSTWTASTIKLAMVVDLLNRDRAGTITLTSGDRGLMRAMLHSSDDDAADSLWFKYAGEDHMAFNNAFPRYGMTSLRPQAGYTKFYPYWGFQKCAPRDLDRLMTYVLTKLPAADRSYIVNELRAVDPVQQWGVWGAGPSARPGNKDGWSEEDGGWVMNTVGFVGPGERYVVSVMNNLRGEGGYDEGRATVTQVSKLLFGGYF